MRIIVTGGAGFIGGAIIRQLIADKSNYVLCLDSLTYASDLQSLNEFFEIDNFSFTKTDLRNSEDLLKAVLGIIYYIYIQKIRPCMQKYFIYFINVILLERHVDVNCRRIFCDLH